MTRTFYEDGVKHFLNNQYTEALELFNSEYNLNKKNYKNLLALAIMYENGYGCDQDIEEAIKILKKNPEENAKYYLGYLYYNNKDYTNAIKYWKKIPNNSDALHQLGKMYRYGYGVKKNEKKAFELVKKSALLNNDIGKTILGIYYTDGIGCDKNLKLASKEFKEVMETTNKLSKLSIVENSKENYNKIKI